MNKNNQSYPTEKVDEELLDFELEELTEGEARPLHEGRSSDEGILELVDVVEKGEATDEVTLEGTLSLGTEQEVSPVEFLREKEKSVSAGSVAKGLDSDLDTLLETLESSDDEDIELQLLESDLDGTPNEAFFGDTEQERAPEEQSDVPKEIPEDDLGQGMNKAEERVAGGTDVFSPAEAQLVGISEEKLEAMITRVVENVVERVARETMITVTERVIKEAIEALKQSLESH